VCRRISDTISLLHSIFLLPGRIAPDLPVNKRVSEALGLRSDGSASSWTRARLRTHSCCSCFQQRQGMTLAEPRVQFQLARVRRSRYRNESCSLVPLHLVSRVTIYGSLTVIDQLALVNRLLFALLSRVVESNQQRR
jgi:hypothetical protein